MTEPNKLRSIIQDAYELFRDDNNGENANYIPYYNDASPDLFGISLCDINGEIISIGNSDHIFGIESIGKLHTAILYLRQHGIHTVIEKIGPDPEERPYISHLAYLLENDHPSNPLLNPATVRACSGIHPIGNKEQKLQKIIENVAELCASSPILINELFEQEMDINFSNESIAWLFEKYSTIYDDSDDTVVLYTQQCSLGVTAEQLAISGATIANNGTNPISKKEIFTPQVASHITSFIAKSGFSELVGNWVNISGLYKKSNVGGAIMGIVPGKFGICVFSPLLETYGTSIRGRAVLRYIMDQLNTDNFRL